MARKGSQNVSYMKFAVVLLRDIADEIERAVPELRGETFPSNVVDIRLRMNVDPYDDDEEGGL